MPRMPPSSSVFSLVGNTNNKTRHRKNGKIKGRRHQSRGSPCLQWRWGQLFFLSLFLFTLRQFYWVTKQSLLESWTTEEATADAPKKLILEPGEYHPHDYEHAYGYNYDSEYCSGKGSMHQLALNMMSYSSPPGSLSFQKLQHILGTSMDFYIDLNAHIAKMAIFEPIERNFHYLLRGAGLFNTTRDAATYTTSDQMDPKKTLLVEALFNADSVCPFSHPDLDCKTQPRFIVQSEQLAAGYQYIDKFTKIMQDCHAAPSCLVLEFSDLNYQWFQQNSMADSVVLLPHMMQSPSRLLHYVSSESRSKPLYHRTIDVAFFGAMTKRREPLVKEIQQLSEQPDKHWNPVLKHLPYKRPRHDYMAQTYADAKICLTIHAYGANSGGEYHRLSELAPFGCISVMETFADTFYANILHKCAGVVFADYEQLVPTITEILQNITDLSSGGNEQQQRFEELRQAHLEWWNKGVNWAEVLPAHMNGLGIAKNNAYTDAMETLHKLSNFVSKKLQ